MWGLIVASGQGKRLGADRPKQFLELGGAPVVLWALWQFYRVLPTAPIVLTLPKTQATFFWNLLQRTNLLPPTAIIPVEGGAERYLSVYEGLKAIRARENGNPPVLVHDAARPVVLRAVIERVAQAVQPGWCVAPAIRPADSLRVIENGQSRPVNREQYRLIQTPQAALLNDLWHHMEQAIHSGHTPSDEASVFGEQVHLVDGDPMNFKITHSVDWQIAQALVNTGLIQPPWRTSS